MMNPLKIFIAALRDGREPELSPEQIQWIADRYPFFTLPQAIAIADGSVSDPEAKKHMMARIALSTADRDMLFRLTDPDGEKFADFYPDEQNSPTPSTDDAINTFLDNYGHIDPKEQALLERLIFNPVPDYSSVLAKQAEEEADTATPASDEPISSQDAMLDAFLSSHRPDAEQPSADNDIHEEPQQKTPEKEHHSAAPTPPRDSLLLESLSKIYIRRKRYDKAYEIISQLSLNFPEKSIYFADQLRFLRKLMLNRQFIDKQNNKN